MLTITDKGRRGVKQTLTKLTKRGGGQANADKGGEGGNANPDNH